MRRALLLPSIAILTAACSSGPAEPPVPADPEDPASVVEAARGCSALGLEYGEVPTPAEPEFHGDPSVAERNTLIGELYLEQVSELPCVYTLPSGMRLRVREASGEDMPTPDAGEMVRAHYDGRFPNGEGFDSSYDRGQPINHPSNGFIAGWNEAMSHMRVGEVWELFIPSNLAYGPAGIGPIGPNQTLFFRMELVCLPARTEPSCEALEAEAAADEG